MQGKSEPIIVAQRVKVMLDNLYHPLTHHVSPRASMIWTICIEPRGQIIGTLTRYSSVRPRQDDEMLLAFISTRQRLQNTRRQPRRGWAARLLLDPAITIYELLVSSPRGHVVFGATIDLLETSTKLAVQSGSVITRHF
jgi:Rad3-related DNA helicase